MATATPGPRGYTFNPFTAVQMGDPKMGAQANTEDEVIAQLTKDFEAGWPLNAVDSHGGTLLVDAASRGMPTTCLFLIDRGIDIKQQDDEFGRNALFWAAQRGLYDVVKLLSERGLGTDEKTNKASRHSFLHVQARRSRAHSK